MTEAYNQFMTYGRGVKNYSGESLAKHRDCFRSWLIPVLGNGELDDIAQIAIAKLQAEMVDRGLGVARRYSVLMTLKVFLKFCREVLKVACLDPSEIRLPKRPAPFVQYLTNQEVERLRNSLNTGTFTGMRMRTLIEVLLNTGLRISEALALNREPFEAGTTEVQIIGKAKKPRIVFFPEATIGWSATKL